MDLTFVRKLLSEQRSRAIGSLLGECERSAWWNKLGDGDKHLLKASIMRYVGGYHDTVLDILKASGLEDEKAVLNELALTAVRDLNHRIQRLSGQLDGHG